MIAHIEGTVRITTDRSAIIDVQGIGYEVFATPSLLLKLKAGAEASLFTHQYIREDVVKLYGFQEFTELRFFEQLIDVSGVGPKSALTIMALAPVADLQRAIARGDSKMLTKVSGIGKKTAERLIVELRSKMEEGGFEGSTGAVDAGDSDVIDALVGLGYSAREARDGLRAVGAEAEGAGARVKAALKILGKKR
ncbi:MAG: Holliday junction branch migration protein RuvA [Patescibacteria group bacterium]